VPYKHKYNAKNFYPKHPAGHPIQKQKISIDRPYRPTKLNFYNNRTRQEPTKSLKEKRAEKKAKKAGKGE
jgi:hypothetical protein